MFKLNGFFFQVVQFSATEAQWTLRAITSKFENKKEKNMIKLKEFNKINFTYYFMKRSAIYVKEKPDFFSRLQ